MSLLFSPAPPHNSGHNVMKNTPRKRNMNVKARDETRFWYYFFYRVIVGCFAVFAVGWIASSSPLLKEEESHAYCKTHNCDFHFSQQHSWGQRMLTFRQAKLEGSRGQAHFSHVQVSSCC